MLRHQMPYGICASFALILLANAPAHAQDVGTAGPGALLAGDALEPVANEDVFPLNNAPRTYFPADFAQFAPRNALDLVEEIPGFTIQGGDGGFNNSERGFGEATGNLLINGARISSKSTSTQDELSRIPVDNVVRIEVVDGANLDIPGLSGRVANVIVRDTGGLSGQFNYRPGYSTGPQGFNVSQGDISVRGSSGPVDFSLALDVGGFAGGGEGLLLITDADGLIDERDHWNIRRFHRPTLSGIFSIDVAPDVTANLNLSSNLVRFRSRNSETRTALNTLPDLTERYRRSNNETAYEIGADIEFPLGPGTLKLIALESFEDGNFVSSALFDQIDQPLSGSRFGRASQQGERIARGEYRWGLWGGDWQLSAEAAFNRLDQVGSLAIFDPSIDDFVDIPFPSGTGGVRESRYESILSFGTSITGNLSLQLQLGGEYSSISQTGSNALSRTFQRPKGSLTLAWAPNETLDISLEVARRVGQLNFGDFLASVNLTDDNQDAGNNQLRPQQSWESELEINKSFGRWGSASLTLFDHRVEDLLIVVPVEGGGEARGNLESANRYGLRFNGTLELAALGWQGAKLDFSMAAEDSSLIDPVTGVTRRFDGNNPFFYRFDFRHDVPETDWAYGFQIDHSTSAFFYRVSERSRSFQPVVSSSMFVENKDVFGLTVRLRVSNLFDGHEVDQRTVFDQPRGPGAQILFTEDQQSRTGQYYQLSISGNF